MYFQLKASKGLLFKTHYLVIADEAGLSVQDGNDTLRIPIDDIFNIYISYPFRPGEEGSFVVVEYFDENRQETQYKIDDARFEGRLAPRIQALLEVEWSAIKNAKRMTPVRRWLNTAAAPHYLALSCDASTFGGVIPTMRNQEIKKTELLKKWNITGHAELLAILEALLDGHYMRLYEKSKNNGNKAEPVRTINGNSKDIAIHAWDWVNLILVASFGYIAGYFSIEDASSWGLKAARKLQQAYPGWQDMYAAYMAGYIFTTGENVHDKASGAHIRDEVIKQILRSPLSPFRRVDWKMPLRLDWNE